MVLVADEDGVGAAAETEVLAVVAREEVTMAGAEVNPTGEGINVEGPGDADGDTMLMVEDEGEFGAVGDTMLMVVDDGEGAADGDTMLMVVDEGEGGNIGDAMLMVVDDGEVGAAVTIAEADIVPRVTEVVFLICGAPPVVVLGARPTNKRIRLLIAEIIQNSPG